jgi:hypothetical protein
MSSLHARRPALCPGTPIIRRPGTVQVGFEGPDAVLLSPAGDELEQWLRLIDGSRTVDELDRQAMSLGLGPSDVRPVLATLSATGLITDPTAPTRHRGSVRLIGSGRIGRAVARHLAAGELTQLELVDDDPVDLTLYPRSSGVGRQSSALAVELTGEDPDADSVRSGPLISVGSGPVGSARADLTVVTTQRLDVDRVLTDILLRSDQVHLLVRGSDGGVVVGPLVVPGRTACVRCTDLVRCAADPHWPVVLSQACRISSRVPEPLIGWAGATAATQVLAWIADPSGPWPETAGATIELSNDFRPLRRHWPRHPDCGCGWAPS